MQMNNSTKKLLKIYFKTPDAYTISNTNVFAFNRKRTNYTKVLNQ